MKANTSKSNKWVIFLFRFFYFLVAIAITIYLAPFINTPEPTLDFKASEYNESVAINLDSSKDELCVMTENRMSNEWVVNELRKQYQMIIPSSEKPVFTSPCNKDIQYPAIFILK